MHHRLRGGKSFVASAPQAFADPSASTRDLQWMAFYAKSMHRRLRDGKSLVACAHEKFADPSASSRDVPSIAGCDAVVRGNPWRCHRPTQGD
jgi:hypothetical protein